MPEITDNSTNTSTNNGVNSGKKQTKRKQRRQLPNPIQSNDSRQELTIKGKISTTPQSVNSSAFELYIPFVLSPSSDEIFIKCDKNAIVSLATGNKYSSACSGYKISL